MKSHYGSVLVVEEDGEIIGFGEVIIDREKNKNAEITKIYIKKGFRNKGIGKLIMKKLLTFLRARKVKSVSAGIFIQNKASINLGKHLGFKISAVRLTKELR